MDSHQTIRYWLCAISLLSFNFISLGVSAKTYTIAANRYDTLPEGASSIFRDIMSKPETVWGEVTDIDVKKLAEADTFYCSFDDIQVELFAMYYGENNNSDYRYVHYVSLDHDADAYVSIYDNYVHIDLRTLNGMYRMVSISESKIAIVRYEPVILEESDYDRSTNDVVDPENTLTERNAEMASTPTIRVLFLYTDSALTMMSGFSQETAMKEEVYRYINEGNQSFANSNIDANLQLAYVGRTNYNESSHTWNEALNHFYGQSDSYMDEVHDLRDKYAADICLLMLKKEFVHCGEAKAIRADESTAFAIILPDHSNCGWRYAAIHEIGHLLGCRHNMEKDSTIIPSFFAYAHGYVNRVPYDAWCTIMSYELSDDYLYSPRKLYWSNPNVYYNGVATGTVMRENNARVWNERAGTVAAFLNKQNEINYTGANNNTDAIFESIEAGSQISVGSGYEIQSGQTVEMTAPTIYLLPGTTIKAGAKFLARTKTENSPDSQFIRERYITPDIRKSAGESTPSAIKILQNGHIFIIRDGKTYTLQGQLAE